MSPDGSRAVFGPRTEIRLTAEASSDEYPVWSHDGARVFYAEAGVEGMDGESIVSRAANGTGDVTRLRTGPNRQAPYAVSPDDKFLVFREDVVAGGTTNLGLLTLADNQSRPLLDSRFNERNADISPNGKWMAYTADETGQGEVYVGPFRTSAATHDVAPNGRFLMLKSASANQAAGSVITMWVNWLDVLRERLAGRQRNSL